MCCSLTLFVLIVEVEMSRVDRNQFFKDVTEFRNFEMNMFIEIQLPYTIAFDFGCNSHKSRQGEFHGTVESLLVHLNKLPA